MSTRYTVLAVLCVALAGVVGFDLHLRQSRDLALADRGETERNLATLRREQRQTADQIRGMRERIAALRRPRSSAPTPAAARRDSDTAAAKRGAANEAIAAPAESLGALRVRTFVGEERLRYAAVLRRLALSQEQLKRFDEIAAQYEQGIVDLAAGTNATAPKLSQGELAAQRVNQLRDLLGAGYDTWLAASQNQGPRSAVLEVLQQSLPSIGTLEPTQAQALVEIFNRHSHPMPGVPYDWDGIATDAAEVLNGPSLETFRTALRLRALSGQMNVLATAQR